MADDEHHESHHEHGHMDISEHEATFAAFMKMSAYVVGSVIVFLIFLALLTF